MLCVKQGHSWASGSVVPHSQCCSLCCSSHNLPITLSPQYAVDCSMIHSLPTISFIINGVQLPLTPSAYVLNVRIVLPGPRGPAETWCSW